MSTLIGLSSITWASPAMMAQHNKPSYWQQIKLADGHIKHCQSEWNVAITVYPIPSIDVEKSVALFQEQSAQDGKNTQDKASETQAARANATMERDGYSLTENLKFQYDGRVVRGEVMAGNLVGKSVPVQSPGSGAHFVDIYDGKNVIVLSGLGPETPIRGTLVRKAKGTMSHSAGGFANLVFLAGAPITNYFGPSDTNTVSVSKQTLILKKNLDTAIPTMARLTLSSQTYRPTKLEIMSAASRRVSTTSTANGYRNYGDGIFFPSHFTIFVSTESGSPVISFDYTLKKVTFNKSADVSDLKNTVPSGTLLDDFRFGMAAPTYRVDDHLPTDNEVRALMAREETKASNDNLKASPIPIVLIIGTLFVTTGIFMWRRASRKLN